MHTRDVTLTDLSSRADCSETNIGFTSTQDADVRGSVREKGMTGWTLARTCWSFIREQHGEMYTRLHAALKH